MHRIFGQAGPCFRGLGTVLFAAALAQCFGGQSIYAQSDYRFSSVGPAISYGGENVYYQLKPVFSGQSATVVYSSVTLSGSSLDFEAICGLNTCTKDSVGRYYSTGTIVMRIYIPAAQPAGSANLTINTSAAGIVRATTISLQIAATPMAAVEALLTGAPSVPNLAKWESTMKTLGQRWCPATSTVYSFGDETQVWYYDGARVYYQIADYTGDRSWETCALRIARQYRDYVIAQKGALPGWRVFTRGLRMAYERTGDATYRQAVILLAKNSMMGPSGGSVTEDGIRETAYIANAYMDAEKLGEPRNPLLSRSISYLLGDFDRLFVTRQYTINQLFFDGLASEALINYYDLTRDARIPPAVKTMLDWAWDNAWNKSTHQLMINPEPLGPKCSWGCREYNTDLIHLTVPAFAWYWNVSGDPIYQERGDEMFAHALDSDISYSGKMFSHNYHWSNMYVKWRSSAGDTACTYGISAPPSAIGPAGGSAAFNVSARSGCAWNATSDAQWAAVTTGSTGSGSGTVNVSVAPNPLGQTRSAAVVVAGNNVTITQTGSACNFTVAPTSAVWLNPAGGSVAVTVTPSLPDCQWSVRSIPAWLSVAGGTAQRSGAGSVTISAGSNNTGATRALIVNVAGTDIYIGQRSDPGACALTVSPTTLWSSSAGGTVAVTVKSSKPECSWTIARPPVSWVTPTGSSSRTGSGSVVYAITPNAGAIRAVIVSLAGREVYIGQHSKGN